MAARRNSKRSEVLEIIPEPRADEFDTTRLLEVMTSERSPEATEPGITIGTIASVEPESCEPVVEFPGLRSHRVRARSTVRVRPSDAGREVAIVFENGDISRPLIIGLIQPHAREQTPWRADAPGDVEIDGERLILNARKEIVIRCGKTSIILTRAGKVLIRGAYLLSRSSGVNRIKGGSVQIN